MRWTEITEAAEALREARLTVEGAERIAVNGNTLSVLRNPSATALRRACGDEILRGLVDPETGDTYWWDASSATHQQAANELGLGWKDALTGFNGPIGLTIRPLVWNRIHILLSSGSIKRLGSGGAMFYNGTAVVSFSNFVKDMSRRELN